VVLEEPPIKKPLEGPATILPKNAPHLLLLSAHNKQTLDALAKSFVEFLQYKEDKQLRDVSFASFLPSPFSH
jgi:acyl transferase domain-containing protein